MKALVCLMLICLPAWALADCGRSLVGNRVVGGVQATPNSWPWQVSLQARGQHMCGGSIVAPQWILSAGHCFLQVSRPSDWTVVAGEHDLRRRSGREQARSVERIIRHPYYRGGISPNDMVLMKLSSPLTYNAAVQPVCLPPRDWAYDVNQRNCMLTGWGLTKGPQDMTKLQQVGGPIVSHSSCRRVWGNQIVENHICFGTGLKGGCMGDSGGPLVCRINDGRWVQTGVVSWGNTQCRVQGYPTVFTRVSKLVGWINGYIHR